MGSKGRRGLGIEQPLALLDLGTDLNRFLTPLLDGRSLPNYNRGMSTPPPVPPKRKRRGLQYSVRSLLVLMLLAAGMLGWLRHHFNRIAEEQAAVAAIQELGGSVSRSQTGEELDQSGKVVQRPAGPQWLRNLFGDGLFDNIDSIAYRGPHCLEVLGHLDNVRGLRRLSLTGTSVSDESLAHLTRFTNLRGLGLDSASITDAGLGQLEALGNLEELRLRNTAISDQCVESLLKLRRLESLDVSGTHLTEEGMRRLRAGLPKLATCPFRPAPDEHQRSIAALLEEKGSFTFLHQTVDGSRYVYDVEIRGVDSRGKRHERPSLGLLSGLSDLGVLTLDSLSLDDEDVEALRKLRPRKQAPLAQLVMSDVVLTDRQWDRLSAPVSLSENSATGPAGESPGSPLLENLESASLRGLTVSDTSLACLAAFPNLRDLCLIRGRITASGLQSLGRSRRLEVLNLLLVNVSKDDLKHLKALGRLKTLGLQLADVRLSAEERTRIRAELPGVNISFADDADDEDPADEGDGPPPTAKE